MEWETIWRFDTRRFTVLCEVTPCQDNPSDVFGFDSDVEAVRNGDVQYFDARVRVLSAWGDELGCDYLGACSYKSTDDFVAGHRDRDPMSRNSSLMRAKNGENTSICYYFPSMVREATGQARKRLDMLCDCDK